MLKDVLRTSQIFQSVLKTILKISRLYCRKRHRGYVTKHISQNLQLKYKLILWIKTNVVVLHVSLIEILFVKRKSVLIVGNSSIMCLLPPIFDLTYL